MPFNGTGTFTLVSGNPVVTGTNISSTVQNNTMSDFANGFTNCITRDGQSAPTSNLPMGNQRHTGAGNATGAGEYLVYGQTLPATTVTSLTVTGATELDGAVTLGDAAADVITFSGTPAGLVLGGSYTPSFTNTFNVGSFAAATKALYQRVGNIVSVTGYVQPDFTSGGVTSLWRMTLPIASNIATVRDISGVAVTSAEFSTAQVSGDISNDEASFVANPTSSGAVLYAFSFQYEVI